MKCQCYFCQENREHLNSKHPDSFRISSRLLVAESLDPRDQIIQFACNTCGHLTELEIK